MFKKEINAKEVYVFAEQCIKVQQKNIELLKKEIEKLEKEAKKCKVPEDRKKILARKSRAVTIEKESNEKIDYLINTMNIILGLYERNGKKFKFSKSEYARLNKKYDILGQSENEEK